MYPNHIEARFEHIPFIKQLMQKTFEEFNLCLDDKIYLDIENLDTAYRDGFFGILQDEEKENVGTFGLFKIDDHTAEIRKMYLLPQARGKGYGQWMLNFLLEKARTLNYQTVILETTTAFEEAIKLYEKHGFKPTKKTKGSGCSSSCERSFSLILK